MIKKNIQKILSEIPSNVQIIAAVKTRNTYEIKKAIDAGIKIIGDNYIQQAELKINELKNNVEWHLIGHLQKNKIKKAIKIFDVIETIDSLELAKLINKECKKNNQFIKVMIEINIAKEKNKSGIFPKDLENFVKEINKFQNLNLIGLMTMGSFTDDSEVSKKEFKEMKILFDKFNLKYLSMGMSNNYDIAIKEGANIVRIGTKIFGKRK